MSSSNSPYIFDEFFTSGLEESLSPFLDKRSRKWGHNLSLKSSLAAGFSLLCAYIASYFTIDLTHFFLLFVYFLAGTPALLRTFDDIKNLELNIDVLMTIAAFLSFMIGSQMEGGLLLVLFAFSSALEESVSKKTKGALINLHHLTPTVGLVLERDGTLFQKSVRQIEVGTHLLVRAGEVVPLDGRVVNGRSFINLVHLTGESIPLSKTEGDEVQAGSRNLDGTLTVEVTKTSAESTLSKIIKLIDEAQALKPKLQRFLDKFGKRYATTIISLFFLFALALPSIVSIPYFGTEGSIYRALTFLIAASPCALIIATPTAYLSAINACARKGILLKGGITLDAFADCRAIAFDKTGTLTTGKLTCIGIEPIGIPNRSVEEALSVASALERHAAHPMAEAICRFATQKKIAPATVEDFQSISGFGLKGKVALGGKTVEVKIGNEAFIAPDRPLNNKGSMLSFLQIGHSLFAFRFEDTLRKGAKQTVATLKERGIEVAMLTGDHRESAQIVAKKLQIDKTHTDLRPENKLDIISKLSKEKDLAMVGDGINDAPALMAAGVGIAMGKIGSATAIDASDIVLLQDDITLISWLHKKAKKTMAIVRQNLTL
ncbi:MAG: heavy metal translocating P-type ATPase, partial [Chlamydiota bacterium]